MFLLLGFYFPCHYKILEQAQKLATLMRDDDGLMKLIRQKSGGMLKLINWPPKKSKRKSDWMNCRDCSVSCLRITPKECWSTTITKLWLASIKQNRRWPENSQKSKHSLLRKWTMSNSLKSWKKAVSDCLEIKELTPLMLNKLIDRIEVGSQEVVDGQRQQEIRIVWRFAREV